MLKVFVEFLYVAMLLMMPQKITKNKFTGRYHARSASKALSYDAITGWIDLKVYLLIIFLL